MANSLSAIIRSKHALSIGVLLAFLLCAILVLLRQKPPDKIFSNATPTDFSLSNALAHLKNIARKPHPLGSPENAAVREYLLKTLAAEGLTPQVQELALQEQTADSQVPALTLRNVVARLAGTANSKAIILVAHYDSVDAGPGAGDDGFGTVTLLETLRALKAGPPLKNDVILLFTDGEERGLFGARAFVSQHPWMKDIGVIMNFDGRGNRGPVLMFDTGDNNGWMIKEFARAANHPFTSSLWADLHRQLTGNTDFTVFTREGLQGLNFGFIDGWAYYHTPRDTFENLDPRTLEHLGSCALDLTRHLGNIDLTSTQADDVIYFDFLTSFVVFYPEKWAAPLALFVSALFIVVMILAFKKRQLKPGGISWGSLAFLLNLAAAPLFVSAVCAIISWLQPDAIKPAHSGTAWWLYRAGFVALTLMIGLLIYNAFQKRMNVEEATLGVLSWWLLAVILTSLFLPSGSYLFTWPLLLALLSQICLFVSTRRIFSILHLILLYAAMLLSITLFVPLIYHVSIAVDFMVSGILILMLILFLGLFLPLFYNLTARRGWLPPMITATAGLALMIAGYLSAR